MRPSRWASACSVVISLRSEVKGISPTRSNRSVRASTRPGSLRSATRNAASVGSPCTLHEPSEPSTSSASLDRLPAASTKRTSSSSTGSSRRCASTRISPSGEYPEPVTSTSPVAVTIRSMVISLRVNVPVLSEQMTDADPSVSTDDSRLTIARRLAIRCTPSASTTERIAGRPSGTAATARETPTSSTSTTSVALSISDVSRIAPITTRAMMITAMPSIRPTRAISRCSGVDSASVLPSRRATLPISVPIPVAVTTATPRPRVTAVPLKTMSMRSPRPASAATGSTSLSTASLSPVSEASAIISEAAWANLASADTASPSASSITSPGTSSSAAMRCCRPSRITVADAAAMRCSAATASSARDSWT